MNKVIFDKYFFKKKKIETVQNVIEAINFTNNQCDSNVKILRSDNGTEIVNCDLNDFLRKRGIISGLNAPYCSEQNGFIEREMMTVVQSARSLLIQGIRHNITGSLGGQMTTTSAPPGPTR